MYPINQTTAMKGPNCPLGSSGELKLGISVLEAQGKKGRETMMTAASKSSDVRLVPAFGLEKRQRFSCRFFRNEESNDVTFEFRKPETLSPQLFSGLGHLSNPAERFIVLPGCEAGSLEIVVPKPDHA